MKVSECFPRVQAWTGESVEQLGLQQRTTTKEVWFTDRDHVSTDEEGQFLGDQVGEVHQGGPGQWEVRSRAEQCSPGGRVASQHQHLGSVVLDVIRRVSQTLARRSVTSLRTRSVSRSVDRLVGRSVSKLDTWTPLRALTKIWAWAELPQLASGRSRS